jgi:sec-independent protein translocase protein TatB
MFGIGFTEILVIGLAILIFVGPGKLPEFTKQLGKMFVKFKRVTNEVKSSFEDAVREVEREVVAEEREKIKRLLIANDKAASGPDHEGPVDAKEVPATLDVVPTKPEYSHSHDPSLGFVSETENSKPKISDS